MEVLIISVLLIFIGLGYLICKIISEANIKPTAPGTDMRQAYLDSTKISKKEFNKRLSNGYYVNSNKENEN